MDSSNGSNGKVIDLLERIAGGIDGVNQRIDGLSQRVDALTVETRDGFATVNGRLDNMLVFLGRHHANHEERIQALEARVFEKLG
jgi:hypothetical protein